jgi:hypothetical protein
MFEQPKNIENAAEFSSKINLRFFRHDEKESDPQKTDHDIELTPKGRMHAKEQATETKLAQSVAFGSPRRRTQETAGFIMAGQSEDITGEESFNELKEKVDKDLGYGTKIAIDPKLNFDMEADNEYVKEATSAFKKGELMKFIVEKSDELAKESGDDKSSTYSRMAASIASIIKKYIGVAPRWNELANDETKKYDPTMNRFFSTHQGMQESFLAKVIELSKGVEERDRFIQAIKNKGFDYAEGFQAEIITKDASEPMIHISFKKEGGSQEETFKFDEIVSMETLERIVG